MQKLINLFVYMSGLGPKVWDFVDGKKTYVAATAKLLTALLGLLGEATPLLNGHNAGGLYLLLKALPADANWHALVDALLALGIGHKIAKIAPPPVP